MSHTTCVSDFSHVPLRLADLHVGQVLAADVSPCRPVPASLVSISVSKHSF
jgi:hypothetical protein